MTPQVLLKTVLDPGLAWCEALPGWIIPSDDRARLELLAIAGQESDWRDIQQYGGGPARGPWQFEEGACRLTLINASSGDMARAACATLKIAPTAAAVYGALIAEARLAVAFARLYLWCDPNPLPAVTSSGDGWETYLRVWRPGAPRVDDWISVWTAARDAVLTPPVASV